LLRAGFELIIAIFTIIVRIHPGELAIRTITDFVGISRGFLAAAPGSNAGLTNHCHSSERLIKAANTSQRSSRFLTVAGVFGFRLSQSDSWSLAEEEFTPVKAAPQVAFSRETALSNSSQTTNSPAFALLTVPAPG